jgi:D-alanyl-D-alanine carboxypeptidase/D-alanyl-D-alanine-endopeptidase (penicillin-binding protein 4)
LSHAVPVLALVGAITFFPPGTRAQASGPRRGAATGRIPPACRSRTNAVQPLARRLECLLDSEPFNRALWGVAIADPRHHLVFERNADRLFVPASNVKLVVSAVASALLAPDYRFRTSVYGPGPVDSGVVRGDLVLYGRGDPTLSGRYYPSPLAAFDELADSLKARGVTRVAGDVVGDASYFDSLTAHPSWEGYDLNWWYAAPVTALAFNDNSIDFHVTPGPIGQPPDIRFQPDLGVVQFTNRARTVPGDSEKTLDFFRLPGTNVVWAEGDLPVGAQPDTEYFAVYDAPAYAAGAFRRSLESRGIAVDGRVRTTYDSTAYAPLRAGAPLAEHLSPSLPDILRPILETSQNWFAEMLLKTLGKELRGQGSWTAGLDVERRFLIDSLKVDSTMFDLADGSGLSTWNLVAPRAFVQLLTRMRTHPRAKPFLDAFPVGAETGFEDALHREATGRTRARQDGLHQSRQHAHRLPGTRPRARLDLLDPAQPPHRHHARGAGPHRRDRRRAGAVTRSRPSVLDDVPAPAVPCAA